MDNEQPHQELVKCVLVGDTAVGKTRLICARACNKHVSLSQLLSTHVPTVWAIDQYRIYKDVLERSWEVVDGVNVSLRLWDTFGDHEKDRRFAYGRSDVVLLCFSIANPVSLRNCRAMWYPEIRRFCPQTPVILVGCKNDLRYMYRDETYLSYFGDRSPFVRAARKSDLVMPDEARAVAKDLGVAYYESSVFTYFGVNEVFENAIRAALIARRQQRFWITNLKRVQRPLLQAPFRPPKPPPPEVTVITGTHSKDMLTMLNGQRYTDLVLVVGAVRFPVHRFVLAAGSSAFHRLLTMELSDLGARSSSESSMVSSTYGDNSTADFNEDTECLLRCDPQSRGAVQPLRMWEQLKRRSSYQALPTHEPKKPPSDLFRELHHPVFQSIRVIQTTEGNGGGSAGLSSLSLRAQMQTIVSLSKLITPQAMQQCLKFIYSGSIDRECLDMQEIRQAADFLELPQLSVLLSNIQSNQNFMNDETIQHYSTCVRKNLEKLCVNSGLFGDLSFELDDGHVKAHRAILVARCDVMRAMLNGDFREAHANVIVFPGVTEYTFHKLLCYLYTDEIPPISADKCLNLLELANRLCLPRLLNLVECRVIEDLTRMSQSESSEAVEHCLKLLEPVKLHNAHQLAEWCMSYLCVNYNIICRVSPKSLKALHPDNQDYLREHRWPPVWYLKDYDYYQRCMNEITREMKDSKKSPDDEGCLCFSGVFCWLTGKSRRTADSSTVGGQQQRVPLTSQPTPAEAELAAGGLYPSQDNSVHQIEGDIEADLNL
ncbi:rho-related BTB domain-containing protein 2 isoform X1 [Phlebotomus argentipes]|uniref:rho-related BTB domain-containing protein 2 isoform X1 n=1 Tax=Phlebotomus argentipes TaxID=94469 RepID=UPI002892AF19|nr:rho-related BTB domain-containing protein 2 isoform X1 [Phlebotomus argentipes]